MAKTIYLDRLFRLTLTTKGKAVAKHPLLRQNVVEAIKASPVSQKPSRNETPMWETPKDNSPSSMKMATKDNDMNATHKATPLLTLAGATELEPWPLLSHDDPFWIALHTKKATPTPQKPQTSKASSNDTPSLARWESGRWN